MPRALVEPVVGGAALYPHAIPLAVRVERAGPHQVRAERHYHRGVGFAGVTRTAHAVADLVQLLTVRPGPTGEKFRELTGIRLDYIRQLDVILASGLQPSYGIVQDREYPEYDYC